jgi:hypothetical protein
LRLLQPLIRAALEQHGVDPRDPVQLDSARPLLSPLTWAVLTSDPLKGASWLRTLRPDGRAVAGVVHSVFDDLDHLAARDRDPHRHMAPPARKRHD